MNINTKLFRYRASLSAGVLLIYHSILSFIKNVARFLNTVAQWLVLVFVTRVTQTGSDCSKHITQSLQCFTAVLAEARKTTLLCELTLSKRL